MNFLSCEVSAIENARRMAEHNALLTEAAFKLEEQINNCPAEQVRVRCVAALVGLVGLGILFSITTSALIGGSIALSAVIPWGIAESYQKKMINLELRFNSEGENNVKFIYGQIQALFRATLEQESKDLSNLWNNGSIIDVETKNEKESTQVISKAFDREVQDYDRLAFYTLNFNNQKVVETHKVLRNYATIIASVLPKTGNSAISRLFHQNNWCVNLQKMCEGFKEPKPKGILKVFKLKDDESFDQISIQDSLQTGRKFNCTQANPPLKQKLIYLLKGYVLPS